MDLAASRVGLGIFGLLQFGSKRGLGALSLILAILIISQPVQGETTSKPKRYASRAPAATYFMSGDCQICHQIDEKSLSHPVDVFPSIEVPSHLPLENGRITCTTCHDDEMNAHGAARAEPGESGLLRGGLPGTAFCANCHQPSDGESGALMHASFLSKAHLQWESEDVGFSSRSGFNPMLDGESQDCMSCHDGASAKSIGPSHPVGVSYESSMKRQTRHRLVPAVKLDSRIRLFDGKLGCGSCHSQYSGNEKFLAVTNTNDRLCVTCHQ